MIDDSVEAGIRRVGQLPALVCIRESLAKIRRAFRTWRRTRPFWGGLLIIVGGSEMLASEPASLPVDSGIRGLAAYLTPTFMLFCGVLLWLTSIGRTYHSLLAILLAIDSWVTSNLGGFYIGILISLVGGALAFAWMTDSDYGSHGWLRGRPVIRVPSWPLDAVSRLAAGLWRQAGRRHFAAVTFWARTSTKLSAAVKRSLHRGASA